MSEAVWKAWMFQSESNARKQYETLLYVTGTTSCNCPGWTRRVDARGRRSCKHTRLVDMGVADSHSASQVDYTASGNSRFESVAPVSHQPKQEVNRGRKLSFK
jgi:hypothetical protein